MKENLELRAGRTQPLFIPAATNRISTPVMAPLLMAAFLDSLIDRSISQASQVS
jgi:hypothetical protein